MNHARYTNYARTYMSRVIHKNTPSRSIRIVYCNSTINSRCALDKVFEAYTVRSKRVLPN